MIVTEFLKKVRSRLIRNQILNGVLLGSVYAIFLFVIVYYLGIFLSWEIPFIIFIGSSIFYFRKIKRQLNLYHLAQEIDKNNQLADTLSTTAYIYEKIKSGLPIGEAHIFTQEKAESLIKKIDLKKNSPIKIPVSLIGFILIGILLFFSIIYIHIHGLDWRYQTNALPYTYSFLKKEVKIGEKKVEDAIKKTEEKFENAKGQPSKNKDGKNGNSSEAQKAEEKMENRTDQRNENGNKSGGKESSEKSGGDQNSVQQRSENDNGLQPKSQKSNEQKEGQQGKEGNQNSSLGQKISNALGNALQKIKDMMSSKSQDGQYGESQQGQGQEGKQNSDQQSGQNSQSGKEGQSQQSQEGQGQQANQGEGKEGQNGEGKAGQGQSLTKGQGKGEEGKEGSGIGSDDGKKDLKNQQDQEAMGKLENIYGQRSKNMKGEASIETEGAKKQNLNTQYSNSNAIHSDKGGSIDRDEIPQDMQDTVKNYMENVHKNHKKSK